MIDSPTEGTRIGREVVAVLIFSFSLGFQVSIFWREWGQGQRLLGLADFVPCYG